jgi:hypothetical protein
LVRPEAEDAGGSIKMADRDQNWGFSGGRGGDRSRREDERRMGGRERPWERRSFGDGGGEPWHAEGRYGARYDQDRAGYGGQEYGQEAGRDHRSEDRRRDERSRGGDERETWRPGRGEPYGDLELNARNRGIREFGPPADYAYHPQAGHEFDPDYMHWREEQMRGHDRDYHEWRRTQRDSYDEDYRRFRHERRQHFGRSFADWRNQRSAVGGVADTTVAPGVGGYGDKVAEPSAYDYGASSRPSGMIERPEAINASPGAGQSGGDPHHGHAPTGGTQRDSSPEFGKEPSAVQRAADGGRQANGNDEEK